MNGTAFEAGGKGPPVVLVHGLGMNRHMRDGQWAALTGRFSVARYDLLGHGESPPPDLPCRMEQFVGQLRGLAILNAAHGRTDAERATALTRVEEAAKCGPAATVAAALERWFTPGFAARRADVLDRVRQWILADAQGGTAA